jgi:glycolate oxidase
MIRSVAKNREGRSYGKITATVIKDLSAIAGKANVISERSKLINYSRDETPLATGRSPLVAVKPFDTKTIAALLKYANDRRLPVTARGGGTGLSGGAIPAPGSICLSLENMDRIIEIDRNNFVAVVQPGVTLGDLRDKTAEKGLSYPVSLGEMTATVGGSISTNAGGMNAVKYGVTRHHVLGLEAVLAGGEIIRTGGKFVKCSSGYDLTQLLIGSEGTLAVITEIMLKLTIKPANREALFIPFHSLKDAIESVPDILMLGTVPVGLEFMDREVMEIAEGYTGKKLPYRGFEAFLLVIYESGSQDEIASYFYDVERVVKQHGAADALVPPGQLAMRRLIEARENFYHALKKYAPMEITDVVVPRSEIARYVEDIKKLEPKYGIPVVVYGHAGDGNVHLHPICIDMPYSTWIKKLPRLMREIYLLGAKYGGAVSAEHGIGTDKKSYFNGIADPVLLLTMKKIKAALDPNGILNPGKIFDY